MSRVLAFSSPGPESEKGRGGGMRIFDDLFLTSMSAIILCNKYSSLLKSIQEIFEPYLTKKPVDIMAHPSNWTGPCQFSWYASILGQKIKFKGIYYDIQLIFFPIKESHGPQFNGLNNSYHGRMLYAKLVTY